MKTVKLKFVGFWPGFDEENNIFISILRKYYKVVLSEKPDYIIFSVFGTPYECCNYDGIRILFSGENVSPDFNLYDYAIGFDYCSYMDRYLRYPLYLLYDGDLKAAEIKHLNVSHGVGKRRFCNFIYGHDTDDFMRKKIFEKLNEYKKVDSVGSYLNNHTSGRVVSGRDKLIFQKKCKFTIAFESNCLAGFVTEKILHGFAAQTIPIYWGDPLIKNDFNSKAFIDCRDFSDFDEVLDKVIEIDNDDDKYMSMLKEPIFEDGFTERKKKELEEFLFHIFNQKKEDAFRRPRFPKNGIVMENERRLRFYNMTCKSSLAWMIGLIRRSIYKVSKRVLIFFRNHN